MSQQRKDEFNLRDFLRKHANGLTSGAIVFVALLLAGISLIASHAFTGADGLPGWLEGLGQNFGTEMCGAAITFVMIEMLLATRRAKEAEEREKERLILQMGSPIREAAVEAARQLAARGWLQDGSLQGANLKDANLEGARLENANLQGAKLNSAILQRTKFRKARLMGAVLTFADLRGASLMLVNFEKAYAPGVDLRGAVLSSAVLNLTNLESAKLQGARGFSTDQLKQAKSLEDTTLPDGTRLPDNDTWREVFEAWCETAKIDEFGKIIPAPLDGKVGSVSE